MRFSRIFHDGLDACGLFSESEVSEMFDRIKNQRLSDTLSGLLQILERNKRTKPEDQYAEWTFRALCVYRRLQESVLWRINQMRDRDYSGYLDSEPVHFDGDIIITDPCYIMGEGEDWSRCGYGSKMEKLGIQHYMTRNTIYGDWSCTTINTDTNKAIGHFCADAGLVSVFLLDEVLKYNPWYDDYIEKPYMVTLIRDFCGTAQFVVKDKSYVLDHDDGLYKKGDMMEDFAVEVVGHGINKITGEPINFVGKQTGM